ncbi:MAG: hypothetical protein LBG96_01330 [Tannerella sp.]|jgi:hypothetical protein|nr:hypothetical protein [Tannerella sp.]
MFSALFYKEWIKTRRVILMTGIILAALIVYTFINTGQMFRISGHVQTWSSVLLKDMSVLPEIAKWFPLLVGLLVGLVQFVPEMTDKRLKLTLHLPLPELKIVLSALLYGAIVLFLIYLLMYMILGAGLRFYYATEIITSMTWQLLPYFLGGLAGYIFTAWVCLEPIWRQRIFNASAAVGGLYLFFMDAKQGAYITFLPYLVALVIVGFCFPFYSAARFKDGAQK